MRRPIKACFYIGILTIGICLQPCSSAQAQLQKVPVCVVLDLTNSVNLAKDQTFKAKVVGTVTLPGGQTIAQNEKVQGIVSNSPWGYVLSFDTLNVTTSTQANNKTISGNGSVLYSRERATTTTSAQFLRSTMMMLYPAGGPAAPANALACGSDNATGMGITGVTKVASHTQVAFKGTLILFSLAPPTPAPLPAQP